MFENSPRPFKRFTLLLVGAAVGLLGLSALPTSANAGISCNRTLTADIVAFDMPLMFNRMGAQNINGMMFALRRDVVETADLTPVPGPEEDEVEVNDDQIGDNDGVCELDEVCEIVPGAALAGLEGMVTLRPDKRPRPLVLRMGAGDCLEYTVTNLLGPRNPFNAPEARSGIPFELDINDQVADRRVSLRFQGTELVNGIGDDGSFVGINDSSLIAMGSSATFKIYAPAENTYAGNSYGATTGGEGLGGNSAGGLFAVLNVGPKNSTFYRSQITREEMDLAADLLTDSGDCAPSDPIGDNTPGRTCDGQPILAYETTYPNAEPWISEGKAGLPIINMVQEGEIVHSDINAIVAHGGMDFEFDGDGHFPTSTYPLESKGYRNPTLPNRLEPFREFTIAYHDEVVTKQAFPLWFEDPVFGHTLHGVRDAFMINYASGGIGSEIISNRLRVGPMHDCVNCAYEEFFLTFFTVGEVGMLTDIPANFGLEECDPDLNNCAATGPKANYALFPDDPSNVNHSYIGDFVKQRNVHGSGGEQHVHHQHNHQWLFNANDDNSNYLDAQGIGPGSGYTFEIVNGGAGNRNKTVGDAIYHCHFYPHFAQGMWAMWRIHDVFEEGTELQATLDGPGSVVHTSFVDDDLGIGNGTPADGARALPDGEIVAGTPIPGVVPLPGKPMAPMPAPGVTVQANTNMVAEIDPMTGIATGMMVPTGSLATVPDRTQNPGYPFWIAGIEHSVGQRPPTPPLDMITQSQADTLAVGGNTLWDHPGFADAGAIHGWDGGLPRFTADGYSAGSQAVSAQTRLDFSKELTKVKPFFFPEEGTDLEQVAMAYHAQRCHDTFLPDGTMADCNMPGPGGTGGFIVNGALPVPGAPYNEPCVDDEGDLLADGVIGDFFDGDDGTDVSGKSPFNATFPRVYKAANVQFDAVFNKLGYHFPQQRIITLWQDVVPTINKERPPEPFVIRMNTFDCTQYVHSNVVPKAYELDDYQVRTPTDIIGQHIHLPKWDLTSADGAANGWNYEDGTLSPEMVYEIIEAINLWQDDETDVVLDVEGNPVVDSGENDIDDHPMKHLTALDHPFFGGKEPSGADWTGARSTMQRWFADPVVNIDLVDRGLGIIFTHDHYGPSTHQQVGLYATVLVEPAGSKWVHNETGTELYTRTGPMPGDDGGPTSWQAAILTGSDGIGGYDCDDVGCGDVESHREFYFEYSDFQHAYQKDIYVGADEFGVPLGVYDITSPINSPAGMFTDGVAPSDAFRHAIQPSVRLQASLVNNFPVDIWEFPAICPGGDPRPCPEAISADDPGMYVVNYRNESLTARVYDPDRTCADGNLGCQAAAEDVGDGMFNPDGTPAGAPDGIIDEFERARGDLAHAMWSGDEGQPVPRAIPELNTKEGLAPAGYFDGVCSGVFCPPINQLSALVEGDPFTPMARAFDGDRVHVKVQAGAHEEEHTTLVHGLKWLQAGSGFGEAKNSGWRNAQPGGISEQFSFRMPIFADIQQRGNQADYAYTMNNSTDGWVSGTWGLIRSNKNDPGNNLFPLPGREPKSVNVENGDEFVGVCPEDPKKGPKRPDNLREYDVTAVLAEDVLSVPAGVTVQDLFPGAHEGRAPNGGTLVYNSRTTSVGGNAGPLHDPTAILYVFTEDLMFDSNGVRTEFGDPIGLQEGTPVEPLVLRANAGDCIEVTLRNALLAQALDANDAPVFDVDGNPVFLEQGPEDEYFIDQIATDPAVEPLQFDQMPDLATGNAIGGMVRRDEDAGGGGMTTFQSNLMAPSPYAGLHAALVEYDVTRHDGSAVGRNPPGGNIAEPGGAAHYRWYAGHVEAEVVGETKNRRNIEITAHPIEFGGFNISAADKIEQGQKGMLGAGVIYPEESTWLIDDDTTTEATVDAPSGTFRDFTTVAQKGASMFYADSHPVENLLGEGSFGVAEDAQDMGHMAINYGTEPLWFRFGLDPTDDEGLLDLSNAGDAYSNSLAGDVDPETAVFDVMAGEPFRQHVLMPYGPGRGSTFDLHGHVWQRDPYVCPQVNGLGNDLGLSGKCDAGDGHAGVSDNGEVGSKALGDNPIGFSLGAIESWFPGEHYEVVIPSAGGGNGVEGDYLFRDHMGLGNAQGLWGIVRVGEYVEGEASDSGGGEEKGKGKGKKK